MTPESLLWAAGASPAQLSLLAPPRTSASTRGCPHSPSAPPPPPTPTRPQDLPCPLVSILSCSELHASTCALISAQRTSGLTPFRYLLTWQSLHSIPWALLPGRSLPRGAAPWTRGPLARVTGPRVSRPPRSSWGAMWVRTAAPLLPGMSLLWTFIRGGRVLGNCTWGKTTQGQGHGLTPWSGVLGVPSCTDGLLGGTGPLCT